MKALITIAFAIDGLEDDDLVEMARSLDRSLRESIAENASALLEIESNAVREMFDWYGATITVKQDLYQQIHEEG